MSQGSENDFEQDTDADGSHEPSEGNDDGTDDGTDDETDDIIQSIELDQATVSQHRKAFVKWVNESFYEHIKDLKKDSILKIYQVFAQTYY